MKVKEAALCQGHLWIPQVNSLAIIMQELFLSNQVESLMLDDIKDLSHL